MQEASPPGAGSPLARSTSFNEVRKGKMDHDPFAVPADDGDTFKRIGLSLTKSTTILFIITASAASAFKGAEIRRELKTARKARTALVAMKGKYGISDEDWQVIADAKAISEPRCGRCSREDPTSTCRRKIKHCNWNWVGSFYFAFTIFTTIGYGTFAPARGTTGVFFFVQIAPGIHRRSIPSFLIGSRRRRRWARASSSSSSSPASSPSATS